MGLGAKWGFFALLSLSVWITSGTRVLGDLLAGASSLPSPPPPPLSNKYHYMTFPILCAPLIPWYRLFLSGLLVA
ncbi:hypothetical protein F4860DRAFT_426747 [Xylaria cubensis]|nr:hypothetical protein F4860DRAFT_426747 [Xylaria cubensis]